MARDTAPSSSAPTTSPATTWSSHSTGGRSASCSAAARAGVPGTDVPDPYYSDAAMFDTVLDLVEQSCAALFRQIEPALRKGPS
jgi:protein-tyrosine-phosphatase